MRCFPGRFDCIGRPTLDVGRGIRGLGSQTELKGKTALITTVLQCKQPLRLLPLWTEPSSYEPKHSLLLVVFHGIFLQRLVLLIQFYPVFTPVLYYYTIILTVLCVRLFILPVYHV